MSTAVALAGRRVSVGGTKGGGGGGDLKVSHVAVDNQDATTDPHSQGAAATNGPTSFGRKRKGLVDGVEPPDRPEATDSRLNHGVKKIKLAEGQGRADQGAPSPSTVTGSPLSPDRSLLPAEIWHHVFTFCPPKSLGCLLATSKLFNLYLDPASRVQREATSSSATAGVLSSLEPNAIWQASRRLFWPQVPTPLRSKTELEMWRLACSPRCQECGCLHGKSPPSSPNPHHPGPGTKGVMAIWAFGSRMCAACLLKKSDKVRGLRQLRRCDDNGCLTPNRNSICKYLRLSPPPSSPRCRLSFSHEIVMSFWTSRLLICRSLSCFQSLMSKPSKRSFSKSETWVKEQWASG